MPLPFHPPASPPRSLAMLALSGEPKALSYLLMGLLLPPLPLGQFPPLPLCEPPATGFHMVDVRARSSITPIPDSSHSPENRQAENPNTRLIHQALNFSQFVLSPFPYSKHTPLRQPSSGVFLRCLYVEKNRCVFDFEPLLCLLILNFARETIFSAYYHYSTAAMGCSLPRPSS
jgi:hypothetical protein